MYSFRETHCNKIKVIPTPLTNGGRSREQTEVRGRQSKIVGFGERCVKTRFRTQSLHKHKDLR